MSHSVSRLRRDTAPLALMLDSWVLALKGEGKSPHTIASYERSVRSLIAHGPQCATTAITTDDIRGFLVADMERTGPGGKPRSPASVAIDFRNLRVFFGWLCAEEPSLAPVNPMTRVGQPVVPKGHKPPIDDDGIKALLAVTSGPLLEDRRDHAIMRILIDTGMRVSGLAGLQYLPADPERTDVHLGQRLLIITLKGGDRISVPVGRKTVAAIDRYLRSRGRHPQAGSPYLWLGSKGGQQFTTWGIRQMLERRGRQAGVTGVHPHRFRRTFAHGWLESCGQEGDLMKITGWKSRDMIAVYAGEMGAERARTAHARLSPGDKY